MVGYNFKYPDYSYRYRLTVSIEVDGKIHSGSSVIEVKWRGGPGKETNAEEIPHLPELQGKRDLGLNNLPRFLWFSNPQDPTTAQKLLVQDIPATFGPSARFAGASVEITNDPIVIDIRQKFAWLKPLEDKPALSDIIYLPNKLSISRYPFIGDAS